MCNWVHSGLDAEVAKGDPKRDSLGATPVRRAAPRPGCASGRLGTQYEHEGASQREGPPNVIDRVGQPNTGVLEAVPQMDHDLIDTLDSHFHYLNEPVTCAQVKPHLPSLVMGSPDTKKCGWEPLSSAKLRIPTPITVHVDQCRECSADLETLRGLALDPGQLKRLRWLYARGPGGDPSVCRRAQSAIRAFAAGSWEGVAGEILSHLSLCPRCRDRVHAHRQDLCRRASGDGAAHEAPRATHGEVAAADLFDYVVPAGASARDTRRPAASHVAACRECLEQMQALHRAVYGIAERPESGVVTVYTTIEDAEAAPALPGDPYADYPIRVQVLRRKPVGCATHTIRTASVFRCARDTLRELDPRVRLILKAAVAAAAMIPLAILFLSTQASSGVTLAEVVSAFGRAGNVHVVGYGPGDQIAYELWISRELDLVSMARPDMHVLYDLATRKKAALGPDAGQGQIVSMSDGEYAGVREMVDSCLGFTLTSIPPDAAWDHAKGDDGREMHELAWTERTHAGHLLGIKYRIVVDERTRLPVELRMFYRESLKTGWECKSRTLFEYLTDAQMRSWIAGGSLAGADPRR